MDEWINRRMDGQKERRKHLLGNDEPLSTERNFPDSSYDLSSIILNTYGDCTASMDPLTTYELILFQLFSSYL